MQTSHTSEARGECVSKIGEYALCTVLRLLSTLGVCRGVEEALHCCCTVTDRTLVLTLLYPPPIKDGTILQFSISHQCKRQSHLSKILVPSRYQWWWYFQEGRAAAHQFLNNLGVAPDFKKSGAPQIWGIERGSHIIINICININSNMNLGVQQLDLPGNIITIDREIGPLILMDGTVCFLQWYEIGNCKIVPSLMGGG